jgi:hypothetical protein
MTLAVRNTVFLVGMVVGTALLSIYAAAGYALVFGPYQDATITFPSVHRLAFFSWELTPRAVLGSLAAVGLTALLSLVAAGVSARVFRRVSSPEVYFITLFLMTIPLETLRIAHVYFQVVEVPALYGILITRVVILARLMGGLSLFTSGIYNAGADYPRVGTVSTLLLIMALVIVYLVPVDFENVLPTMLNATGFRGAIWALVLFLAGGAIVNYAIGWSRGYVEHGATVFLAVTALAVGWVLLTSIPGIVPGVIALALVPTGAAVFIATNRSYYLWY